MIALEQPDERDKDLDNGWVLSPGFLKRPLDERPIRQA